MPINAGDHVGQPSFQVRSLRSLAQCSKQPLLPSTATTNKHKKTATFNNDIKTFVQQISSTYYIYTYLYIKIYIISTYIKTELNNKKCMSPLACLLNTYNTKSFPKSAAAAPLRFQPRHHGFVPTPAQMVAIW